MDEPLPLQVLVEVAGGYQIVTRSDLHEWVRRLFHERTTQKLTVQALETLAVIAYRQPLTRAEMEQVRGVSVDGVMQTLVERGLVEQRDRPQDLGLLDLAVRAGLQEGPKGLSAGCGPTGRVDSGQRLRQSVPALTILP